MGKFLSIGNNAGRMPALPGNMEKAGKPESQRARRPEKWAPSIYPCTSYAGKMPALPGVILKLLL